MGTRSEYEAAYFTLLRAREERDDLLRYREYLEGERARLDRFVTDTQEASDPLPRRVRRRVDQTTKGLLEAVGRRRSVVLEELGRIDGRITNAEAFVEECEAETAAFKR